MIRLVAVLALIGCHASGTSPAMGGDDDLPGPDAPRSSGGVAPKIPAPTGMCPEIKNGDVTFAPAGIPPRKVNLALDESKPRGELVIYWYATGSGTFESGYSLGATEKTITDAGGVVATPYADSTAGTFEWFIVNQSPKLDDFLVADEIVGCLVQAGRVDPLHVHSMGMSAGALQTTALSFLRSDYIASVATYSGGVPPQFTPANENPANKFAALIFDGGSSDMIFGVDFQAASMTYATMLSADGHYAELCDHGNGHNIPLDAAPAVATFFDANPFGAWPSPYAAAGVPASFPSYCAR